MSARACGMTTPAASAAVATKVVDKRRGRMMSVTTRRVCAASASGRCAGASVTAASVRAGGDRRASMVVTRAAKGDEDEEGTEGLTREMIDAMNARRARKQQSGKDAQRPSSLDDVNPVNLGRKSRAVLENVFKQLTALTQIQKSTAPVNSREFDQVYDSDLLSGSSIGEFETPNAKFTTVLVTGATGRIGRVLIRKLLLRGYTVKALVRSKDDVEKLPGLVQVIVGDVGNVDVMKSAMVGVNKVIYCASANSNVTSDLYNVEFQGVVNVVKSMQDYYNMLAARRAGRSAKSKVMLTNFKYPTAYDAWQVNEVVNEDAGKSDRWSAASEMQSVRFEPLERDEEDKEPKFATFNGFVMSRNGKAEVSSDVSDLQADVDFSNKEGLLFRFKGDGKRYSVVLTQENGSKFRFSFNTTGRWQVVRMPFHKFVNEGETSWGDDGDEVLDLKQVKSIGLRFDAKKNQRDNSVADVMAGSNNKFELTLEYVKAIPKGEEPDVILVSCFGAGLEEGEDKDRVLKYKRDGERVLRNSGVGYTIVRPGLLLDEAGGRKALVFDQGERINTPIACADVADVCVKAMHDGARNLSFDVGYEYESAESAYELIDTVKGKGTNYLTPALSVLEKSS